MKKIFNQKNFNILLGHLWIVELTYIHFFAFKFTLRYLQPDINPIVSGGKFAAGIVDTSGKFATGINNTSETSGKICRRCRWYQWKICHRCRWYRWSTLSCEYLREFSKKFETASTVYTQGAWGKLIHEKNQKQKISWHCPFKCSCGSFLYTLLCWFLGSNHPLVSCSLGSVILCSPAP